MYLNTTRIAAGACQFKQVLIMSFFKAVFLAVLIHIAAPIVVHFVEKNYPINCVHETQHGGGQDIKVQR